LDVLTDTSSGGEMPQKELEIWASQRNRVNRFYTAMGYSNINVNQKTFCEDAYGREQQFRNYKGENRNMLTTNATARLMAEIVLGRVATPERTKLMMDLMKRTLFTPDGKGIDPAPSPAAPALIERKITGAGLWSKSGGTSRTLHDAVYIETPDGLKFVLVVFTENHVKDADVIPAITGKVIDGLRKIEE
jgi:beta-lactamase class A